MANKKYTNAQSAHIIKCVNTIRKSKDLKIKKDLNNLFQKAFPLVSTNATALYKHYQRLVPDVVMTQKGYFI